MSESDVRKAIECTFGAQKETLETHASYLGQHVDEVLQAVGQSRGAGYDQLMAVAQLNAAAKPESAEGDTWYTGSASLAGAIRGSCDAGVYFGDAGNYKFSGSMWTSPIVAAGGGAGAWSLIPRNGQDMDFTWWGASAGGGAVNILWNINGTIVGSMAIAVAGVGGGGGDGSGTWTKGN